MIRNHDNRKIDPHNSMKKILQFILLLATVTACTTKPISVTPVQTDLQKHNLRGDVIQVKSTCYTSAKEADGSYTKGDYVNYSEMTNPLWDADDAIWASVENYNEAGMITLRRILNEMKETQTYAYNPKGKLIETTYSTKDRQGDWQEIDTYNADGQIEIRLISMEGNAKPITIRYLYDAEGKLVQENYNDQGTTTFTYDQKGNPVSEVEKRNADGFTIKNSTKFNYAPDGTYLGKETTILDSEMGAHTVIYFNAHNLKLSEVTDGITTVYTYNEHGDRTKRESPVSTTTYQYTYDKRNNWTEKIRTTSYPNPKVGTLEVAECYMTIREISYKL